MGDEEQGWARAGFRVPAPIPDEECLIEGLGDFLVRS